MRREKTVVEEAAEMDDSEKKEIVGVLMREQTTIALRLNREQTRQEEMVIHLVNNFIKYRSSMHHPIVLSKNLQIRTLDFTLAFDYYI